MQTLIGFKNKFDLCNILNISLDNLYSFLNKEMDIQMFDFYTGQYIENCLGMHLHTNIKDDLSNMVKIEFNEFDYRYSNRVRVSKFKIIEIN